jgi:hypothetical protein
VWPLCDPIDLLRNLALQYDGDDPKQVEAHPYLAALTAVLNSVVTNRAPPDIIPCLSSNRFVALFKNPSDLTKLRTIDIGTSWRRLARKAVLLTLAHEFAVHFVAAGQYGIAVNTSTNTRAMPKETLLVPFLLPRLLAHSTTSRFLPATRAKTRRAAGIIWGR